MKLFIYFKDYSDFYVDHESTPYDLYTIFSCVYNHISCICVNRLGYYSILNHSSNFEIKYNNIIVTDRPVSLTQVLISHTCTSSARSSSHTTKAHTAASVLVRSCDYNVDSTPGIVTSIQFMYLPGYSYLPSVLSSSVEILHCLLQFSSNGNTEVCASSDLSSDSRKTKDHYPSHLLQVLLYCWICSPVLLSKPLYCSPVKNRFCSYLPSALDYVLQ